MRDMTIDGFSQNDGIGAQESELADLRARLDETERDGAQIALRAEETERKLRDEIAHNWRHCQGCENKRRILAFIGGIPLGMAWFNVAPWGESEPVHNLLGVLVTFSPLLVVFCRWHWIRFRDR
jgi:hypothetical protein